MPSDRDLLRPGYDYIFQQDGAPCHIARKCMKWLADINVEVLAWPGKSPELNPIENLWSRLKHAVAVKRPINQQGLTEAVISSWYHLITPEHLAALVESMPRRCQAVIDAKGFPTQYWTLQTHCQVNRLCPFGPDLSIVLSMHPRHAGQWRWHCLLSVTCSRN